MLNPTSKKFRQKVVKHFLECAEVMFEEYYEDEEVEFNEENVVNAVINRFLVEANFPNNRKRIPNHYDRVTNWLFGLPLGTDYICYDIRHTLADWYEIDFEETFKWDDSKVTNIYYGKITREIFYFGEKYHKDLMRKIYFGNLTN